MPDTTDAPYGASVPGVRGLLPHRTITNASKPSEEDVARFLSGIGGKVYARVARALAAVEDTDETAELTELARQSIELGAAAMTEDAAFPERAGVAGTGYGEVLWVRHRDTLADLLAGLGIDATEGTVVAVVDDPVGVFPEPLFTRDYAAVPPRW